MKRITPLAALMLALSAPAFAQVAPVPPLMNFQARLAKSDGTPLPDGTYTVMLSLWDAVSGGDPTVDQLWMEIETVTTQNGMFAVTLGNTTALTDGLFNNPVWLEIQVGMDAPLAPRQQLVTVAHAFKADTVPDGSITATQIAAGTITADKLAPGVAGGFSLPFVASAAADSALLDLTNTLHGATNVVHIIAGHTSDTPRADGREIVAARCFPLTSLPHDISPRLAKNLQGWLKLLPER